MNAVRTALFWTSAVAAGVVFTLIVGGLFPGGRWVGTVVGAAVALTCIGLLITSKSKR